MTEHNHDPFSPEASVAPPAPMPENAVLYPNGPGALADDEFREARWVAVGASGTQIEVLRAEFESLSQDDRRDVNAQIDSAPNSELAANLGVDPPDDIPATETATQVNDPADPPSPVQQDSELFSGTVTEVLSKVGSDKDLAQRALALEQERDPVRTSLVRELQKIVDA